MNRGLNLVSGGTDNHLILMDLTGTGRTGKEMETLLGQCNITVNKNTIPGETLSPMITSGVRVGNPCRDYTRHGGKRHGADSGLHPPGLGGRRERLLRRKVRRDGNDEALPAV